MSYYLFKFNINRNVQFYLFNIKISYQYQYPYLISIIACWSTSNIEIIGVDPLDNSNLCDILMLERALETEAHVSQIILKLIKSCKSNHPQLWWLPWCGYLWFYETNSSFKRFLKFHLLKVWHPSNNIIMMNKQMILLIPRPHMEHTTGSTRYFQLHKQKCQQINCLVLT